MKTVLIVEDHSIAVQILFSMLEGKCRIVYAKSLTVAKELMSQRLPDLILLDNQLPDGYGVDFCRVLKQNKRTKDIPVIMITGDSGEEMEIAAFAAGVDDFITKPITINTSLARVKRFL